MKKRNDYIKNVILAADANHIDYYCAVIESIEINTATLIDYHVICDIDITTKFLQITELFPRLKDCIFWYKIDESIFEGLHVTNRFPRSIYFRYLAPKIVNQSRAVYLDCDVLVRCELAELFETDIGDCLLAAVANQGSSGSHLGKRSYFNAGVMYINLDKWREASVLENLLKTMSDKTVEFPLLDQDAINYIVGENWVKIPEKFNWQTAKLFQRKTFPGIRTTPSIVHFTGNIKPWNRVNRLIYVKEYKKLIFSVSEKKYNFIRELLIIMYQLTILRLHHGFKWFKF